MPGPGFEPTQRWEMYDLWAVVTLHHTSLCEPLNVQLQYSNSGDRRLFPSKRQKGLRGFLSSVSTRSILPEPGHQSELNVKTNSFFSAHFPSRSDTAAQKHSHGLATVGLFFCFPAASNKYSSCDSTSPSIFTTKHQCWYKTGHWDLPGTSLVKRRNLPISTAAQEPPPLPKNSTLTRTS